MNNQLKIASCLLGLMASVCLAEEARGITLETFSEGSGNRAMEFGMLGLNGGTGIPDSVVDASIPFTDTNFDDVIPNESVRTFGELIADGVIPSGSILQDVEVFFFGELNTREVAFSNVDPNQDLNIIQFDYRVELDLEVDGTSFVQTSPMVDGLAELGPNGTGQLPNPIPGGTSGQILGNLPRADEVASNTAVDLTPFLGPGGVPITIDVTVDGDGINSFVGSGGVGFAGAFLEGRGEFAVEYTYAPIPFEAESGIALIAVSGLIGYRQIRKRRQK